METPDGCCLLGSEVIDPLLEPRVVVESEAEWARVCETMFTHGAIESIAAPRIPRFHRRRVLQGLAGVIKTGKWLKDGRPVL